MLSSPRSSSRPNPAAIVSFSVVLEKLALIGHGKMGLLMEELAGEQALEVVGRFTGSRPLRATDAAARELPGEAVLIDFSTPDAVVDTVRSAAELSLDLVIGTTGWQAHLEAVRETVEAAGIGVVYGSNFSLGINLFYRVIGYAARTFAAFDAYDPFVLEWHHKFKRDSPSGTALELESLLARSYGERDLPITSLRAGYSPSTHAVGFDSVADTLHFEHQARSRRGFAEGALLAAKWIAGRRGFYTFQQVLEDIHPKS